MKSSLVFDIFKENVPKWNAILSAVDSAISGKGEKLIVIESDDDEQVVKFSTVGFNTPIYSEIETLVEESGVVCVDPKIFCKMGIANKNEDVHVEAIIDTKDEEGSECGKLIISFGESYSEIPVSTQYTAEEIDEDHHFSPIIPSSLIDGLKKVEKLHDKKSNTSAPSRVIVESVVFGTVDGKLSLSVTDATALAQSITDNISPCGKNHSIHISAIKPLQKFLEHMSKENKFSWAITDSKMLFRAGKTVMSISMIETPPVANSFGQFFFDVHGQRSVAVDRKEFLVALNRCAGIQTSSKKKHGLPIVCQLSEGNLIVGLSAAGLKTRSRVKCTVLDEYEAVSSFCVNIKHLIAAVKNISDDILSIVFIDARDKDNKMKMARLTGMEDQSFREAIMQMRI